MRANYDDATVVVLAEKFRYRTGTAAAGNGPRFADTGQRGVSVPELDLTARIEVLEAKVDKLEELPGRVAALESQIVHLRTEMRDEFSAVRSDVQDLGTGLRQEIREQGGVLRQEMRGLNEGLREEMIGLNDRTLTLMRVLHEDMIERIKWLGEGNN